MASVDGLVEEEFAAAGRNDALTDAVGIRVCMSHPEFIETLCGEVHPKQLASLFFTLSQSGVGGNLKDAFQAQGIEPKKSS